MAWFLDALFFVGGFAACWFTKDTLVKVITGTQGFIDTLEAKIAAAKAAK